MHSMTVRVAPQNGDRISTIDVWRNFTLCIASFLFVESRQF